MQALNYVPAFWFSSNNVGDNMTHYIIKKMSGKTPVLMENNTPDLKYMVTGSIMSHPVTNAGVWGCGIASRYCSIPNKSFIYAVRGRITGERLNELSMPHAEVYGDPALLLPRLYTPPSGNEKFDIGIIPHYVDTKTVYDTLGLNDEQLAENGVKIIDALSDVETFINDICSCKKIISSSLHGLIVAVAYGIPAMQASFGSRILGDGCKYIDFNTTLKEPLPVIPKFPFFRNEKEVRQKSHDYDIVSELSIDLDALWQSCPFKK